MRIPFPRSQMYVTLPISHHIARTNYINIQQACIYSSEMLIYNSVFSNCFVRFGNTSNQVTQTTVLGSDEYFNVIDHSTVLCGVTTGQMSSLSNWAIVGFLGFVFKGGGRNELKRAFPALPSKNISAEFIEPTLLCFYKQITMEYLTVLHDSSGGDWYSTFNFFPWFCGF